MIITVRLHANYCLRMEDFGKEAPCNALVRTCMFAQLERSKGYGTSFSFHHGKPYLNGWILIYFSSWIPRCS